MRLLDISPAMGLSFVIDTTGSMGEEIKAARRQAWEIIQQRRGTAQEPDQYLLVPFHDPDFGPAYKTSNSEEFLQHLNSISPLAGGDEPEMCLSALQLALLNSPPLSEIFVFTDASAKDRHLKNSVKALIEERRCKVTFLITEDPSRTRVRREILAPDRFDLYVSLALHSGGQVIFTDNNNIWSAAEVIGESAATSGRLSYPRCSRDPWPPSDPLALSTGPSSCLHSPWGIGRWNSWPEQTTLPMFRDRALLISCITSRFLLKDPTQDCSN
uniref:von Willebrand factor A domain containing 7 n=1 Tax=Sphenodon punctatus TaxID=8508 RepID=A0A8D0GXX0_SPHPU